MITTTVDTATPSPNGLALGCRVEGPEGSWVRFNVVVVPWRLLSYELLQRCLEALDKERSQPQHDVALW